ncbi:MAG: aminotransferase class I/II-fold pyridoxal phosphate-dependent enzyme [Aquincola sp.]|nr:aminotransferase class I/II-fold pyridoxal phosphate-dependent enzyme [Aquincola sp.]
MSSFKSSTVVDLRSDTVTLPTESMYARMRVASLGDDGLDGDPTARELEHYTARLLNKPAGLYAPSATMANLLAILAQVDRQGVVLAGAGSHIYTAERGAATFTGAFYQPIPDPEGALDLAALTTALASTKGSLQARLVCIETSHNNEGGAVASLDHMRKVFEVSRGSGVRVHLDGARLFNAALALGESAARICEQADTVSVCLSKGLSAPMGAVLMGPEAVIHRARWLRKLVGGAQRQVGICAAAGLDALTSQVERLAEDHASAQRLAEGLRAIPALHVKWPGTNIVQVNVAATGMTAKQWEARLHECGVLVRPWGPHLMRCVTHRHIDKAAVEQAIAVFRSVAEAIAPTTTA